MPKSSGQSFTLRQQHKIQACIISHNALYMCVRFLREIPILYERKSREYYSLLLQLTIRREKFCGFLHSCRARVLNYFRSRTNNPSNFSFSQSVHKCYTAFVLSKDDFPMELLLFHHFLMYIFVYTPTSRVLLVKGASLTHTRIKRCFRPSDYIRELHLLLQASVTDYISLRDVPLQVPTKNSSRCCCYSTSLILSFLFPFQVWILETWNPSRNFRFKLIFPFFFQNSSFFKTKFSKNATFFYIFSSLFKSWMNGVN